MRITTGFSTLMMVSLTWYSFLTLKRRSTEILLTKPHHYGFGHKALSWFASYLTDRRQITVIQGNCSQPDAIRCGVPQGSILVPLLFLLYINDLPNCKLVAKTRLDADDTSLTFAGKNITETQTLINEDLKKVSTWLLANKLTLNVAKTKYMLIGTRQRDKGRNDHSRRGLEPGSNVA